MTHSSGAAMASQTDRQGQAPEADSSSSGRTGSDSAGTTNGTRRSKRERRRPARQGPSIKPSVVHIPAHLLPLIAAERAKSGRSNGQLLIAAIEEAYEELLQQHKASMTIGGRLFASRTAKPQLPPSQPLSPLNIRMYEHDYDVLDKLVSELGAGSRSRLATLALVSYLDRSS